MKKSYMGFFLRKKDDLFEIKDYDYENKRFDITAVSYHICVVEYAFV